jgi:hypothetical protein
VTERWLLWGFIATVVLTTLLSASQGLGFTRMNLPYLLGTIFTADRDRAKVVGIFLHLVNGWLFAAAYFAVFRVLGGRWWIGAIGGIVHAAFVLTAGMQALPGLHPRMASAQEGPAAGHEIEPPGFLALHYGIRTPVSIVIAHVIFGAILGVGYGLG